jgi:hypothetical protein
MKGCSRIFVARLVSLYARRQPHGVGCVNSRASPGSLSKFTAILPLEKQIASCRPATMKVVLHVCGFAAAVENRVAEYAHFFPKSRFRISLRPSTSPHFGNTVRKPNWRNCIPSTRKLLRWLNWQEIAVE